MQLIYAGSASILTLSKVDSFSYALHFMHTFIYYHLSTHLVPRLVLSRHLTCVHTWMCWCVFCWCKTHANTTASSPALKVFPISHNMMHRICHVFPLPNNLSPLLSVCFQKSIALPPLPGFTHHSDGLLMIIQHGQSHYQKRAYLCIKFLVNLCNM